MTHSTQPKGKCHTRHAALMFAGIISQHLPAEMTFADMEAWRNDPEGLEAVLAGLKSPPVSTGAQAPLHVASPRTIDFHRPDGGVTKAVLLASDQSVELPMLPSLNGPNSAVSAERMRQNPHRKGGAELPDHLVD